MPTSKSLISLAEMLLWGGLDRRPKKRSEASKSVARHTYDHSYDRGYGSRGSEEGLPIICFLVIGCVTVVLLFLFPFLVVCIFCFSSNEYTCKWTLRFDEEGFEEYKATLAERSKKSSGPNHRVRNFPLLSGALLNQK